jgi:hypothetical protein
VQTVIYRSCLVPAATVLCPQGSIFFLSESLVECTLCAPTARLRAHVLSFLSESCRSAEHRDFETPIPLLARQKPDFSPCVRRRLTNRPLLMRLHTARQSIGRSVSRYAGRRARVPSVGPPTASSSSSSLQFVPSVATAAWVPAPAPAVESNPSNSGIGTRINGRRAPFDLFTQTFAPSSAAAMYRASIETSDRPSVRLRISTATRRIRRNRSPPSAWCRARIVLSVDNVGLAKFVHGGCLRV